jgi:hypothetical protein
VVHGLVLAEERHRATAALAGALGEGLVPALGELPATRDELARVGEELEEAAPGSRTGDLAPPPRARKSPRYPDKTPPRLLPDP